MSHSLKIIRTIKASPQRVFAAFASEEGLSAWMGPGPCHVTEGAVDFVVGGAYRLSMKVFTPEGERKVDIVGRYTMIEPPHRMAYTWAWEGEQAMYDQETLVELEFRPHEEGTELVLSHSGFQDQDEADHHTRGWNGSVDKLDQYFS